MENARMCPLCQRPLDGAQWERKEHQSYALGQVASLPTGSTWERKAPARSGDLQGDLWLPLGQSVVTGLVGAVGGFALGGLSGAGIGGAAAFGGCWLVLLKAHRSLLWTIERVTGADLDGDQVIGKPETPVIRVEMSEQNEGGQRWAFADLPATKAQMSDLATALFIHRQTFSRRNLAGKDKPFSDPGFRVLQQGMLDAGLLWPTGAGANAGYKLSPGGRDLLRQFLPGHQVGGCGVGGDRGT